MVLREQVGNWLRHDPAFVDCCHAAHKAGFLLPYLAQTSTPDYRDVEAWADVINALFEHPRFRFDWANQVKEGILAAHRYLFPKLWKKV